ncbi:MAG: polyprenyl synthetase family protein [Rickettsiales bacterium]|jgi:octaprenyl-diphosphate synthase|nr:polyprenyl synthetase family protein [Rickettsiales bacterium]
MTTAASQFQKQSKTTLNALYGLVRDDLKRVDQLIMTRVANDVPLIGEIAHHIVASGGKRIRPALTLISAQLCGYRGDQHIALATAIEFIHTATLLHDDVVDESKLRRGLATANEMFGNKASVLVGDFLLSQAFQIMVEDGSLRVLQILSDASAVIAKGEVMQLMTEGEPATDVQDYLKVIHAKTAELFAAACELGAVASGQSGYDIKLRQFGTHIGMAFQLIDDVLDYIADEQTLGKTIGDDFREGKVTLPIILAYKHSSASEQEFWKRTISDGQQETGDLSQAIQLMNKYNAINQTIAMAEQYCDQACQDLASFEPSAAKDAMLDVVEFCRQRVY